MTTTTPKPSSIRAFLAAREVAIDQIVGKTVKCVPEDGDGGASLIAFTDGTFLWTDHDNNNWWSRDGVMFVAAGLITHAEVDLWRKQEHDDAKAGTEQRERAELARLRAKYEKAEGHRS